MNPAAAHGAASSSGEFIQGSLGITAYAQLLNPGWNIENAFLVGLGFQSHTDHRVVFRNASEVNTLTFTGHGYLFKLEDEYNGVVSLVAQISSPPGLTWSGAVPGSTSVIRANFNTTPQTWATGDHLATAFARGTYNGISPAIIHDHPWKQLGP